MNAEHQTLMFSATFGDQVQLLGNQLLQANYIWLCLGLLNGACPDVQQVIFQVDEKDKNHALMKLLEVPTFSASASSLPSLPLWKGNYPYSSKVRLLTCFRLTSLSQNFTDPSILL